MKTAAKQETWRRIVHEIAESHLRAKTYCDVEAADAEAEARGAWDEEGPALAKEARLARIRRVLQGFVDEAGRRTTVATQIDIFGERHHVYRWAKDAAGVVMQRRAPRSWYVAHLVNMVRRIPLSFLPQERAEVLIGAIYAAFEEKAEAVIR